MPDFREIPEINAAKRLGIQRCAWMNDWFVPWSPRNENKHGEGTWHHWANLAAAILSHPATKEAAPHLYREDLKYDPDLYYGGAVLSEEQVARLFRKEDSTND